MESRIIKVKTDGDILRDAYLVTGFEIDGSEYDIYCIDRDDTVYDNIFSSKLIKDIDGTYNMANFIVDKDGKSEEREKISNVIRSLVKSAVQDNDHDTFDQDTITIDGNTIRLFPVIINKEQTISTKLSYITTVKKAVSEVTKRYFSKELPNKDVKTEVPSVQPVVEEPDVANIPVIEDIPTATEPVLNDTPIVNEQSNVVTSEAVIDNPEMPVLESGPVTEKKSETPVVEVPEGLLLQPEPEPVAPTVVAQDTPEVQLLTPDPVLDSAVSTPESPAVSTVPTPVEESKPVETAPVTEALPTVNEIKPVEYTPEDNKDVLISAPETPVVNVIPTAVDVQPKVVENPGVNAAAVNIVSTPEVLDNKLVLDGTHESNLNSALGEMSEAIPVSDIGAIKDFGVDEPVASSEQSFSAPQVDINSDPKVKTLTNNNITRKAGFANSKFFMFVALAFFFASCVFLGYEVFNYFQIVK